MKNTNDTSFAYVISRHVRIKLLQLSGIFYFILHIIVPKSASQVKHHKNKISEYAVMPNEQIKKSISDVKREQCIGCGLCFSLCKFDAISMSRDETGFMPLLDEKKCVRCGICYKACPGINILEYPGKLGDVKKFIVSHAKDPKVRHNASSGGACRSILISLLEKKIVDKVIITRTTDDPYNPETIITSSVDNLSDDRLNSVYSPTSPLASLKNLEKNTKYALVGLPCHIAGVKLSPQIKKNIYATIGIFCSHTPSFKFVKSFLEDLSPDDSVKCLRYRGDGWPGKSKVHFKDGKIFGIPFPAMWHKYNYNKKYQQERCSTCTYYSAEFADVSIGDPWSLVRKDHEGSSLIFVRTDRGMEIVDAAAEKITLEEVSADQKESILKFHETSAEIKQKNCR